MCAMRALANEPEGGPIPCASHQVESSGSVSQLSFAIAMPAITKFLGNHYLYECKPDSTVSAERLLDLTEYTTTWNRPRFGHDPATRSNQEKALETIGTNRRRIQGIPLAAEGERGSIVRTVFPPAFRRL